MNASGSAIGSPSRWSRRIPTALLAFAGMAIAGYLAAYQLGIVSTVWDPFFDGSPSVLGSSLSRSLPIPDALLGAGAYALEGLLDLVGGGERRWREHPRLVMAFGLVSAGLAMTAIGLVLTQALVVRAFCSLCLASAAISLTIGALAWEEIIATLTHLRRAHKQPKEKSMTASQPVQSETAGPREDAWRGPDKSITLRDRQGVVVVTGAAAGLGRAIVREFAKHGYDVGLIARSEEPLDNARREVEWCGRRSAVCAIDVSDADAVEQAAAKIEAELGPIDVWVNDAMVSVFSPIKKMTADEFKRVTEVNYLGYVYGTQAALRRMLPRDKGVVIHVGSALAYRSIPLQAAYCATKHAILGFHESLRTELIHDGSHVRTTMVQMPALNTPQFEWVKSRLPNKPQPVPPIYQPEVGAEAVYWAAHHDRREVLVGGSTWLAVNVNKFVPALLDWYLGKTGYQSQQTDKREDAHRPNDVWQPMPGDPGAHGMFDANSHERSIALGVTAHRTALASAIAVASVSLLGLWRLRH